jgi:hypothetical protein
MRPRINAALEQRINDFARNEGRDFQSAFDRLVKAGLQATGHPAVIMRPPLGDLSDDEMTMLKIPLSLKLRAELRAIAAEQGHSQRRMAAKIIEEGLKTFGATV